MSVVQCVGVTKTNVWTT